MTHREWIQRKEKNRKRDTISPGRWISFLCGLAGIVWFSFPFLCGVSNIGGFLGMGVSVTFCVGSLVLPLFSQHCTEKVRRWSRRIFLLVLAAGLSWTAFLSGCMVYGAGQTISDGEECTVVVLGSKVNGIVPSADLSARIDAAASYLKEHPDVKVVASGGQGDGEWISEAKAIRDGLVHRGIREDRIFLEETSTSTKENLQYSLEILRKEGLSERLVLVTDEYHQFRAQQIAASLGLQSSAVCARTPWYIFPACWVRELLALTQWFILG